MRFALAVAALIAPVLAAADVGNAPADVRFPARGISVGERSGALLVEVENAGGAWLHPTVKAELYDPDGRSVGRYDAAPASIAPDGAHRFAIDLRDVEPGRYTALVLVDAGDRQVFGTQAPVVIP